MRYTTIQEISEKIKSLDVFQPAEFKETIAELNSIYMLASIDDRIKIMVMMEEACKGNRMIQWVCRNVLRNIHICRHVNDFTSITEDERSVVGYWYADFIQSLPYLRVIADKVQICSIMSLYNDYSITESVFKELESYALTYLPLEYQDAFKHYHNALEVILSGELDNQLKRIELDTLTDMNRVERLLETVVPTYHAPDGKTVTLYYDDNDITLELTNGQSTISDTSQSLFDTAVDFVVQFISNLGSRHWLVDQMRLADSLPNDKFLEHINYALETAKQFDYITPTKKHSVIAGGGVIAYDTSTF